MLNVGNFMDFAVLCSHLMKICKPYRNKFQWITLSPHHLHPVAQCRSHGSETSPLVANLLRPVALAQFKSWSNWVYHGTIPMTPLRNSTFEWSTLQLWSPFLLNKTEVVAPVLTLILFQSARLQCHMIFRMLSVFQVWLFDRLLYTNRETGHLWKMGVPSSVSISALLSPWSWSNPAK